VEKLLEDAQIKLSVVASDIFGVSGREMMAALIGGQTNPQALARLARGRMRATIGALEEAFTGRFTDHHALLLTKMLTRIDALDADIAELDAAIEEMIAPFASAVDRLDEILGVGTTAARVIIAEVGLDMSRFPTAAHLASWARFAPGVKESAGRKKGKATTGHGNRYLARALGEAAVSAGKTNTFLGERYRRIAKRRGTKRAIVALGRSILVIVWHLSSDPQARFVDLGPDFYDNRIGPDERNATTSANSKLWATRSSSSPPPERGFPPPRLRDTNQAEPVVPLARPQLDFRISRCAASVSSSGWRTKHS
jgi:transposase